MKMTWCVVEGTPDEIATLLAKTPEAFADFANVLAHRSDALTSEPVLETSETVAPVAPVPTAAPVARKERTRSSFQPPMRDRVVSFLEGRTASLREIAEAINVPSAKISPRLADLQREGIVKKATDLRFNNSYGLANTIDEMPIAVPVATIQRETSERDDFLLIINALVDSPDSKIADLREATGVSIDLLSERLRTLENRKLVSRSRGRYRAIAPTRTTQFVRENGKLRDIVLDMVRRYPGNTSFEIACRLGYSYSEVARRLADILRAGEVRAKGRDKGSQRYYATQNDLITA